MNTLYLHIGTTKTGTKSLQNFCKDNQDVLAKNGYYYPMFEQRFKGVASVRNGHFLLVDENDEESGTLYAQMMNQLMDLFEIYPNIILSDEGLWSAPDRIWEILKKESKSKKFQVQLIVYLRRQDLYACSSWNQTVKNNGKVTSWENLDKEHLFTRMKYGTRLKKLAGFWKKDRITVRRFEPERFIGGSLYADFLQTIGLTLTDEYTLPPKMQNTKLAGNTHEIMRILNAAPDISESSYRLMRTALQSFSELSGQEYPNEMFSEAEAKAFLAKYDDENRMVSKTFFHGEPLFQEFTWKNIPKWTADNPHMTHDIIRFIGACTNQLVSIIDSDRKEIRSLKKELERLKKAAGMEPSLAEVENTPPQ